MKKLLFAVIVALAASAAQAQPKPVGTPADGAGNKVPPGPRNKSNNPTVNVPPSTASRIPWSLPTGWWQIFRDPMPYPPPPPKKK